ncbi:hypothetical protein ACN27F_24590 [Solwaraspora sp. WMMB335]|uniref:hypothetical protein n=1 Tax=Solwaraspora sp. WMMB335 TaxID=3404118 RepID=UPI003B9391D1
MALRRNIPWHLLALTATPMASLLTVVLYLQLDPWRWAQTAVAVMAIYTTARIWPIASRLVAGRLAGRTTTRGASSEAADHRASDDNEHTRDSYLRQPASLSVDKPGGKASGGGQAHDQRSGDDGVRQ